MHINALITLEISYESTLYKVQLAKSNSIKHGYSNT
jgi:hypothetical protein